MLQKKPEKSQPDSEAEKLGQIPDLALHISTWSISRFAQDVFDPGFLTAPWKSTTKKSRQRSQRSQK